MGDKSDEASLMLCFESRSNRRRVAQRMEAHMRCRLGWHAGRIPVAVA